MLVMSSLCCVKCFVFTHLCTCRVIKFVMSRRCWQLGELLAAHEQLGRAVAIIWAVQKCEFYLKGLPDFTVATDHRSLIGTFSKGISELINPRLQRLRENVSGYQFTVTYVPGKTHNIADALSRAPIFPGSDDLDIQIDTALALSLIHI